MIELDLFTQFTIIVVLAGVFGVIARLLKQPAILGYLCAGILFGYLGLKEFFEITHDKEIFDFFSDLGIMFLLFLVGLEINYSTIRIVGRDAVLVGLGQVTITFFIGYVLANLLGFAVISSLYIALALTFSSTVIVVNLLSEKRDLNSLYGKISLGILLVQDLVVIVALVLLTGTGGGILEKLGFLTLVGGSFGVGLKVLTTLIIALLLFVSAFWLGRRVLPFIFEKVSRRRDLIFLSGVAWLFFFTGVVDSLGFSREIGGFLAGLTLANSFQNLQLANRMKSLRDFFILIFFVILGSGIVAFGDLSGLLVPIFIFSLFVLVGNPLIVLTVMGFLGYKKRAAFLTGMTIAQISEFSLILASLGFRLGHIDNKTVTLITGVGIITITMSTYFIEHSEKLFQLLSPYLGMFERKKTKKNISLKEVYKRPVLIVGFHRTGESIAVNLPKEHLVIIDFDPENVRKLAKNNYDHIFGDMNDSEVLDLVDWKSIRVVISTSPDLESNLVFVKEILQKRTENKTLFKIIVRARTDMEAKSLYDAHADYVILPHFSAGRFIARSIAMDPYLQNSEKMKEMDLKAIEKRNGKA